MIGGSLSAVLGRMSAIRARVEHVAPQPRSATFDRSLVSAQEQLGSVDTEQEVHRESTAFRSFTPVGMLGTPVITRSSMPALGWTPGSVPADWAARLPDDARPWVGAIESAAAKAGLDPRLLAAVVWTESGFRPDAVSSAGAIGLTQLMPGTAEGLGVDPADPVQNLNGGARFLASMIRRFGSLELGLAAYNAGPGRVAAANRIPDIPETQAYVPKVLARYLTLGGAT